MGLLKEGRLVEQRPCEGEIVTREEQDVSG